MLACSFLRCEGNRVKSTGVVARFLRIEGVSTPWSWNKWEWWLGKACTASVSVCPVFPTLYHMVAFRLLSASLSGCFSFRGSRQH